MKLACYPCGVLFEAIAAAKDFSKRSRQSIQRITFYHWVRLVAGASQCIMQEHKPELLNKGEVCARARVFLVPVIILTWIG